MLINFDIKQKYLRFYSILLLINLSLLSVSQEFSLRKYSIPEGLAQTQIQSIYQDRNGYMWIGTKGGISRFDGVEFNNFSVRDGLPHNYVGAIYENQLGEVFVIVRNGMAMISKNRCKPIPFPEPDIDHVAGYIPGTQYENYFLLRNKKFQNIVYQYNKEKWIRIEHPLNKLDSYISGDDFVVNMVQNDSIYFIRTIKGAILEYADNKIRKRFSAESGVFDALWHSGELYFRNETGLYRYIKDRNPVLLFNYTFSKKKPRSNFIFDQHNGIWFVDEQGRLCYFNRKELLTTTTKLNGSGILFKDREETIWLGGQDGDGLFCIENPAFVHYLPEKTGVPRHVWSIVPDRNGDLWFGGYTEGFAKFDYQSFDRTDFPNVIAGGAIALMGSIFTRDKISLFSVSGASVVAYDGKTFSTFLESKDVPGASMYLFEDTVRGRILSCLGSGDLTIRENDGKIKTITVPRPSNAYSLLTVSMDEQNRYWLGYSKVIMIYDGEHFSTLPNEECSFPYGAMSMQRDQYGTLWVGNELGLFAIKENNYQKTGEEYFNNYVSSLCAAGTDTLIIGGINGLGILNLREFNLNNRTDLLFFDQKSGFKGIEVAQNCITPDFRGNYWIATSDIVVRFDPDELRMNTVKAQPIFTSLETMNKSMEWNPLVINGIPDSAIQLKWADNNIRIKFGATSLRFPHKVTFSYLLEGNDENWSAPSTNRYAVYTNLSPGKYRFLLKASNDDCVWNHEYASININIVPAWWQTWIFKIVTVLSLSGIVIWLSIFLTNRRRNRLEYEMASEKKMTELRLQTLHNQMDPHFTFNVINAIKSVVMRDDKEKAGRFLDNFSVLLRKMLEKSDQITRTVREELEFSRNYLELQQLRYKNKFEYQINIKETVNQDQLIPKMVIHTYVENAVKHGLFNADRHGILLISIGENDSKLIIRVQDNGIGRKKAAALQSYSTGKGLKIMKQYFDLFNERNPAKIETEIIDLYDDNQEPSGTLVLITIPIHMTYYI